MYITNQILIQLNEATLLANSGNPHKKRLAVILLDNMIEVQLRRKIDNTFSWDRTTWYGGSRKFTRLERQKATRGFKELLKFAVDSKWISNDERDALTFSHRVRNLLYHTGKDDSSYEQQLRKHVEIALCILYSFISHRFLEWGTCTSVHEGCPFPPQPGYEIVQFGSHKSSDSWVAVLPSILDYHYDNSIPVLVSEYLYTSISDTINQISYIEEYLNSGNDFNYVLNQYWYLTDIYDSRIKDNKVLNNLDDILFFYSYLRKYRDILEDIDDLNARHQAAQGFHNEFSKNPDEYLIRSENLNRPFWGGLFGDALDYLDFCSCLTDGVCDHYDYRKSPIRSKSNKSRASKNSSVFLPIFQSPSSSALCECRLPGRTQPSLFGSDLQQ